MASASVNITYLSKFGTRGSGNDNFDFPTGICVAGSHLYIVDKQNHRIKKHDLTGTYVSEFGTVGNGNDNFYFPEDICTDGTYLYIVDGANHRIKKHNLNGTFISEYGSQGFGNNQFEYPVAITIDSNHLYVADKGNSRIMKSTLAGAYVAKYGTYGNGLNKLSFPEGITIFDGGKLAISDSANKRVVILLAVDFSYITEFGSFDYASRVNDINGVLSVSDRQANKVYFYDYSGAEINTYNTDLFFPESIFYDNGKMYLCDTASHEIEIFTIDVSQTSSFYLTQLLQLTKQLYPTGRAWYLRKNGIFEKLHEALAFSEANAYQTVINQLNVILPDNDNFTDVDATRWEECLGLNNNSMLTLAERKTAIIRKMNHPGDIKPRQARSYIENQLILAGFNIKIYENKTGVNPSYSTLDPTGAIYGNISYGQTVYNNSPLAYTIIANYIDEAKDSTFTWTTEGLKQSFYIAGVSVNDYATVDINRKNEFRELILKLKPAQMFGLLKVIYV